MSDDLISRQAAIKWVKTECNPYGKPTLDFESGKKVIEYLEHMPPAQQWVLCSERLPEDFEEVIITWIWRDPDLHYDFLKNRPFVGIAVYYNEKWHWYSTGCIDLLSEYGRNFYQEMYDGIEVIAWMPLPEPYKEEE